MSYLLPHLRSGYAVDQAILAEEDRVVIVRFGHDYDPNCMEMDEVLAGVADQIKNFAVIYLVDISEVPDFTTMYELYDPCTTMFFFRNKHIMIDLGTGNNNKISWAMNDKQVRARVRMALTHMDVRTYTHALLRTCAQPYMPAAERPPCMRGRTHTCTLPAAAARTAPPTRLFPSLAPVRGRGCPAR